MSGQSALGNDNVSLKKGDGQEWDRGEERGTCLPVDGGGGRWKWYYGGISEW